MGFKTKLIVSYPNPDEKWLLEAPLVYETKRGNTVVVPDGYTTDLASVPRWAWRIVRPDHPTVRRASALHDYLYTDLTDEFTKAQADNIFYKAMIEDGTSKVLASLMWLAVRVGGEGGWS